MVEVHRIKLVRRLQPNKAPYSPELSSPDLSSPSTTGPVLYSDPSLLASFVDSIKSIFSLSTPQTGKKSNGKEEAVDLAKAQSPVVRLKLFLVSRGSFLDALRQLLTCWSSMSPFIDCRLLDSSFAQPLHHFDGTNCLETTLHSFCLTLPSWPIRSCRFTIPRTCS